MQRSAFSCLPLRYSAPGPQHKTIIIASQVKLSKQYSQYSASTDGKTIHLHVCKALRAPGRQWAQEGGKVFSPKHRPPLPPGDTPTTHFC